MIAIIQHIMIVMMIMIMIIMIIMIVMTAMPYSKSVLPHACFVRQTVPRHCLGRPLHMVSEEHFGGRWATSEYLQFAKFQFQYDI